MFLLMLFLIIMIVMVLVMVLIMVRGRRFLARAARIAVTALALLLIIGVVALISRTAVRLTAEPSVVATAHALGPRPALADSPLPRESPRAPRPGTATGESRPLEGENVQYPTADSVMGQSDDGYSIIHIDYARRPEWVESIPVVNSADVDRIAVSSGPWVLRRESRRALDEEIKLAANEYINDHLESDIAATLLSYDLDHVKQRLIAPGHQYEEVIQVSVGPMHQAHALLQFDSGFRDELEDRWNHVVATSRLLQTGLGAGGVLALLALTLAYLRLDTATRGYYTRRLQFAAAMAILSVVAAGILLAQWIPWI